MSSGRLSVLVLGYVIRFPLGGMTWHYLQYLLGLRRLGHDVWFLEDSDDFPSCYDPTRHVTDTDPTTGLRFARDVFRRVELSDRWAYYDGHADRWHGPAANRIDEICADADMLINVSASNPIRPWLGEIPIRIYLDTDPAFEQIRQLTVDERRQRADRHTHFFSFGENIERGRASVPNDGRSWHATRQPIVLEAWPASPGPPGGRWTTVMQWDSYPAREYDGRRFGQKSESFVPFLELPGRVPVQLEIALGSPNAPRDRLRANGWHLEDPLRVTANPWSYQDYIHDSRAEFSIAKHGYVTSRCGWFSERSAAYLATGRPVVAQDTGFSDWLQPPAGLIPFSTLEEAVAGIERVEDEYALHCRHAREIAHEFFDSDRVLRRLLDRAGASRHSIRDDP